MDTKTDKTAYWNWVARLKAQIKYSAAVTTLARRGSAKAKQQYHDLWERGDKGFKDKGNHKRKLNELWKQESVWRDHGQQGGRQRRHRLLAYGYLRGRTYKQMESKCREDNKPDPKLIAEYAFYYGGPSKDMVLSAIKLWFDAGDVSATKVGAAFEEAARLTKAKNELMTARRRALNAKSTLQYKESAVKREQDNLQRCESALERAEAEVKAAEVALREAETKLKSEVA